MATLTNAIAPDFFAIFPDYTRIVLIGDLGETSSLALQVAGESSQRDVSVAVPDVDDPRLVAWRDAFRTLGYSPTKFRPSVDALVRRVAKFGPVLTGVALVDVGNLVSTRFAVPVGAHALDDVPNGGTIELAGARGTEIFETFNGDRELLEPGEIVLRQADRVMTRRWVWRQGQYGSIQPPTGRFQFHIDLLGPGHALAGAAENDLRRLLGGAYQALDRVVLNARSSSVTSELPDREAARRA
jgi:DNA/RNA-binding domain of Phe-tRNA-synthetase-like protein